MSAISGAADGQHLQQLKISLMELINEGDEPYDILVKMAEMLGQESAEPGYGEYVKKQIRAVYGYALGEKKLLADEENEIRTRLSVIESRKDNPEFSEDVRERIVLAIEQHERKLKLLAKLIKNGKE